MSVPKNEQLLEDGVCYIGKDGSLKCTVDGEIIETDQGEFLKWNARNDEWDEIDKPANEGGQ